MFLDSFKVSGIQSDLHPPHTIILKNISQSVFYSSKKSFLSTIVYYRDPIFDPILVNIIVKFHKMISSATTLK